MLLGPTEDAAMGCSSLWGHEQDAQDEGPHLPQLPAPLPSRLALLTWPFTRVTPKSFSLSGN